MSSSEPLKESDGTGASAPAEETISAADQAAIDAAMAEETAPTAKSLKCIDCGKLFKNADLANYHAEKSGHENFEESVEEVVFSLSSRTKADGRLNHLQRKRRKQSWKS